MTDVSADAEAVRIANRRFYSAIEGRDLALMLGLWERSRRAMCIHPGWPALRGWAAVQEGWARLLDGPLRNQFLLTNLSVTVEGDTAWVVLDEDVPGHEVEQTVVSTNIFARHGGNWLMVSHHASFIDPMPYALPPELDHMFGVQPGAK